MNCTESIFFKILLDQDFDDGDLRSLSKRVLPLTSISYTNNTSSHNNNRNHSIQLQKNISSDNRTFHFTYNSNYR